MNTDGYRFTTWPELMTKARRMGNEGFRKPPQEVIEAAAELRAAGASWDDIGRVIDRKPDTVRTWEIRFSEVFRAARLAAGLGECPD